MADEKKAVVLDYIVVPAGTAASQCRGKDCKALIYWIERPSRAKNAPAGKMVKVPVDCDHNAQCHPPQHNEDGLGVNHFQTCADVDRFSRSAKK